MAITTLVLSTPQNLDLVPDSSRRHGMVLDQVRQLEAFVAGIGHGGATLTLAYETTTAAAKASATLTFASVAASNVIRVNGVDFRAVSGTPVRANGEFKRGVSNTADAADFVTTFKASTDARISGVLTASSAAAVVTITAQLPSAVANAVVVETLGIVASGTVTYSSSSGAQTVVINGVTVYNATGASDTANATAAAAAINASANALVSGFVAATSAAGVCTIWSLIPGVRGNAITLTATGTGATASGSGFLAGGTLAQWEGAQAIGTWTTSSGSGTQHAVIAGVDVSITWATSDANSATLMVNAINSNTSLQGLVYATSSSGVVTITAVRGGVSGNAITTTASGTGATAQQARLTGGAVPTQVVAGGTGVSRSSSIAGSRLAGGKGAGTAPVSITQ